jgi:hypothetical protein
MCEFGKEKHYWAPSGWKSQNLQRERPFQWAVYCLWEPKFILREQCIACLRVDFNSSSSASNSWTFDLPHSTMSSPVLSF